MPGQFLHRYDADSNRRRFTLSFWVKRSSRMKFQNFGTSNGSRNGLMTQADSNGSIYWGVEFDEAHESKLRIYSSVYSGANSSVFISDMSFHDSAQWYHIVISVDTENFTNTSRHKVYVNGEQITGTEQAVAQNSDLIWNYNNSNTYSKTIGAWTSTATSGGFDQLHHAGQLADVFHVDGKALGPEYFGRTVASKNNKWTPKNPSIVKEAINAIGGFGLNGFYLPMSEAGGTQVRIGEDRVNDSNAEEVFIANFNSADDYYSSWDQRVTYYDDGGVSTSEKKFGNGSLRLGGGSGTLQSGTARIFARGLVNGHANDRGQCFDLTRGTDFTVDFWIKTPVNANESAEGGPYPRLFDFGGGNTYSSMQLICNIVGTEVSYTSEAGTPFFWDNGIISHSATGTRTPSINDGNWHHMAFVKHGTDLRTYVDGTYYNSRTVASTAEWIHSTNNLDTTFGEASHSRGSGRFQGFIDGFRFIKGTALYTGASYNVSTAPPSETPQPGNHFVAYDFAKNRNVYQDSATNNFATLQIDNIQSTVAQGATVYGNSNWTEGSNDTPSTMLVPPNSGKWYAEAQFQSHSSTLHLMVHDGNRRDDNYIYGHELLYRPSSGDLYYNNGTSTSSHVTGLAGTPAVGDVYSMILDTDAYTISFYRNGSLVVTHDYRNVVNWDETTSLCLATRNNNNHITVMNYGQDHTFAEWPNSMPSPINGAPFSDGYSYGKFFYDPTTLDTGDANIQAFCDANLRRHTTDIAKNPRNYFDIATWAGNQTSRTIDGLSFKPDLVLVKSYSGVSAHHWRVFDSSRQRSGATDYLPWYTSSTQLEDHFNDGGHVSSFNDDGFSLIANPNGPTTNLGGHAGTNGIGTNYIAYAWKKTPGVLDVQTWTGDGTGKGISHNLGRKPRMMIYKNLSSNVESQVYFDNPQHGSGQKLKLHSHDGRLATNSFNDTEPTSTTFYVGNTSGGNAISERYVGYLFGEEPGFSKFGYYYGENNTENDDAPFIWCGFKPKLVIIKGLSTGQTGYDSSWAVYDNVRDPHNPIVSGDLQLNTTTFEGQKTGYTIDFKSNGFHVRGYFNWLNLNGWFVFAAFAETPFELSNAR